MEDIQLSLFGKTSPEHLAPTEEKEYIRKKQEKKSCWKTRAQR